MRFSLFPRTAFTRSALVVALVIGLSQALTLWFFARNAYLPGIRDSARLTMMQAELAIYPETRDLRLAERLAEATDIDVGRRARPDADDIPLFAGLVVDRFQREMERLTDEPAQVRYEEGKMPVLWVNLPSFGNEWMRVPMGFFRHYDRYLLIGWGVTVPLFALLGGLLIARGMNRPLKRLEKLVASLGRDDPEPDLDADSGPEEIIAVNRALTRMARELHQAQRDRALLLAGVSHDLRTPLTRIRLSAEFLDDEEISAGIVGDIEDMDAILDQFIAFIRDGSDEEPVYENLNDLIEDVAAKYEHLELQLKLRALPKLMLKRLTMKRMLSNLFTNAERYGKPPVDVRTRMEHGEVVLVVRDHGRGIREEDIPQLLQPFSRGEKARTMTGSGLGLAIIKRIVDMHHGRMTLSNHPGGGLQVEIRFLVTGRLVQPEALSSRVR